MTNIVTSVASGLIISFITMLAWLAYKHPEAYTKLSKPLNRIALIIIIAIASYDFGVAKSLFDVNKYFAGKTNIDLSKLVDEHQIPIWSSLLIYVSFSIYLAILDNLHYFLKKKTNDTPQKQKLKKQQ